MAEHARAEFPILADLDQSIARKYGVYDLLDDGVAAPATFIIASDGVITWYDIGENITDRPSAEEVLGRLKSREN